MKIVKCDSKRVPSFPQRLRLLFKKITLYKKASYCEQEMSHSYTTDQPMAREDRETEHRQTYNSKNTIEVMPQAFSSSVR